MSRFELVAPLSGVGINEIVSKITLPSPEKGTFWSRVVSCAACTYAIVEVGLKNFKSSHIHVNHLLCNLYNFNSVFIKEHISYIMDNSFYILQFEIFLFFTWNIQFIGKWTGYLLDISYFIVITCLLIINV